MESHNNAIAYELRSLKAEDMFPMFNILSKIGIKEFKHCFEDPAIQNAIARTAAGEESEASAVGMTVVFDVAGILMENLPKAKEDIYLLLSQLSGISKKDIADLPMIVFTQMIVDVIRKEEFKDFFQVVSKLFK